MEDQLHNSYNKIIKPEKMYKIKFDVMDKIIRNLKIFIAITIILTIVVAILGYQSLSLSSKVNSLLN